MSKKLTSFLISAGFILILALGGCGGEKPKQTESSTPPAKVTTPKVEKLKMGCEAGFPPFEFQEEGKQGYVGFDIDLVQALGKEMNVEIEVVNIAFDSLLSSLATGQIDLVASGMSITEERSAEATFSKPYYKSGLSVVVKSDNHSINSIKDLEGKRIAVQSQTTSAEEAKRISGAEVKEFRSSAEAFELLRVGACDAVINDIPVNEYYMNKLSAKDFRQVGQVINSEDYGIAVAKRNHELVTRINKALDIIKENGEYEKIYLKWFGRKPPSDL